MKKLLMLVLASLVAIAAQARPTREQVLRAIQIVESAGNPAKIGRLGERGLYQFRSKVWADYTSASFKLASTDTAHGVAVAHYEFICAELRSAGFEPTAKRVAMVWNGGIGNFLRNRVPPASVDYGERVSNLAVMQSAVALAWPERSTAKAASTPVRFILSDGSAPMFVFNVRS